MQSISNIYTESFKYGDSQDHLMMKKVKTEICLSLVNSCNIALIVHIKQNNIGQWYSENLSASEHVHYVSPWMTTYVILK